MNESGAGTDTPASPVSTSAPEPYVFRPAEFRPAVFIPAELPHRSEGPEGSPVFA